MRLSKKKKKKMKKAMFTLGLLYYKSSTNIMVFTDVRQLVLYLTPSISNLELSTEETGQREADRSGDGVYSWIPYVRGT